MTGMFLGGANDWHPPHLYETGVPNIEPPCPYERRAERLAAILNAKERQLDELRREVLGLTAEAQRTRPIWLREVRPEPVECEGTAA